MFITVSWWLESTQTVVWKLLLLFLPNEHAMIIKMFSNYLYSCLSVWREKLLSAVDGRIKIGSKY